jgi:hypothetical protein
VAEAREGYPGDNGASFETYLRRVLHYRVLDRLNELPDAASFDAGWESGLLERDEADDATLYATTRIVPPWTPPDRLGRPSAMDDTHDMARRRTGRLIPSRQRRSGSIPSGMVSHSILAERAATRTVAAQLQDPDWPGVPGIERSRWPDLHRSRAARNG